MSELLKCPLTPIPLLLCHLDGTLRKTDKRKLMHALKNRVPTIAPTHVDAIVVDGFFFLHLLNDVPRTFGRLATFVLVQLCRLGAVRIDVVVDRMFAPSIKDTERLSRAGGKDIRARFKITGPQMVVPTNFHNALGNSSFKESLGEFFVESWNDDALASILGDKIVYITKAEHCFSFRREGGKVDQIRLSSL